MMYGTMMDFPLSLIPILERAGRLFGKVSGSLLRVGDDGEESVGIALDPKVKAVVVVYPGLPDASRLVVLLGPERGVSEVGQEKAKLLVELGFALSREHRVLADETFGESRLHEAARRRARMASLAVRNGPMNRPCLKSWRAKASSRSMALLGVKVIFLP